LRREARLRVRKGRRDRGRGDRRCGQSPRWARSPTVTSVSDIVRCVAAKTTRPGKSSFCSGASETYRPALHRRLTPTRILDCRVRWKRHPTPGPRFSSAWATADPSGRHGIGLAAGILPWSDLSHFRSLEGIFAGLGLCLAWLIATAIMPEQLIRIDERYSGAVS
jgi:hypothetical protein